MDALDIIDWRKLLIPYEQAVAELEMKFRSLSANYRQMGEYSPIEMVFGRVKNIMSILDKASRKNIPLRHVEEQMEDIAGIRIVTKFVEDIARIVLLIRERDGMDLKIVEEIDYVNNTKQSGYRSYHIIIKYTIYTPNGPKEIFVEIQIRTLAMNFWSTIEHSLRYKYNENIPEDVKKRLTACAEAAYQLDNEMATIRGDILEAQKLGAIKAEMVKEILTKINKLHLIANIEEASHYNLEFTRAYMDDDMDRLSVLNKQLTVVIEMHRLHGISK